MTGALLDVCASAGTLTGFPIGEGLGEKEVEGDPNRLPPLGWAFRSRGSVLGVVGKADRSRGVSFIAPCGYESVSCATRRLLPAGAEIGRSGQISRLGVFGGKNRRQVVGLYRQLRKG